MRLKTLCNVLLLFGGIQFAFPQEEELIPRTRDVVSVGLNISYYHPSLDNLNNAFALQEELANVPAWEEFEVSYLANASIRYTYDQTHRYSLEFGGSYLRRERDNAESLYRIYKLGLQYNYIAAKRTENSPEVYFGGGGGGLLANFFQSYNSTTGTSLLQNNWYLDFCVGMSIAPASKIGAEIEARYMYVPTLSDDNLNTSVNLTSFTIALGLVYTP